MLLRTYALYNCNRRVLAVLVASLTVSWALSIVSRLLHFASRPATITLNARHTVGHQIHDARVIL